MIKTLSAKQVKVLQNIGSLQDARKDDGDQVRKKRRLTSSMVILDEEPVFSDSEEEREFSKAIFGSLQPITIIPVKDKYCDAEVQCDLLTPEKTLYGLINQCSKLNADNAGDFKAIIKSCEVFIARRSFNINDADALSDITDVSKNYARCSLRLREKKKGNELTKSNNELKEGPVNTNECKRKSDNKKRVKRTTSQCEANGICKFIDEPNVLVPVLCSNLFRLLFRFNYYLNKLKEICIFINIQLF